jgi:hypothetical protein
MGVRFLLQAIPAQAIRLEDLLGGLAVDEAHIVGRRLT